MRVRRWFFSEVGFWFIAVTAAVLYWGLEDLTDVLFGEGSFTERLFPADPNEVLARLVTLMLLVAFGVYFRRAVGEHARLEHKYRSIFENAVEGIFQITTSGHILTANPAMAHLFGYQTPEEFISSLSENGEEIWEDPESRKTFFRRMWEHGSVSGYETTMRRRDGTPIHVSINAHALSPTSRSGGELEVIEGTVEDVTVRKRAEEAAAEIREAERRRIARDLHDVVLQDLVAALQAMQAAHLRGKVSDAVLSEAIVALREAVQGLRSAVYDLRPERERPLVRLVESMMEFTRQRMPGCEVRLIKADASSAGFPEEVKVELVRIVQEALSNARRHSGARHIEVILGSSDGDGTMRVEVADDGTGFLPDATSEGVGLSAMRERALALGGELEVHSEIGAGTKIAVRVPSRASRTGTPARLSPQGPRG